MSRTSTPGSLWSSPPPLTSTVVNDEPTASVRKRLKNVYGTIHNGANRTVNATTPCTDLSRTHLQIGTVRELVQVARNTKNVLVSGSGNVGRGVVKRAETRGSDRARATRGNSRERTRASEKVGDLNIALDGRRAFVDEARRLHAPHCAEVGRRRDDRNVLMEDVG